jgi:hypothetical protein
MILKSAPVRTISNCLMGIVHFGVQGTSFRVRSLVDYSTLNIHARVSNAGGSPIYFTLESCNGSIFGTLALTSEK